MMLFEDVPLVELMYSQRNHHQKQLTANCKTKLTRNSVDTSESSGGKKMKRRRRRRKLEFEILGHSRHMFSGKPRLILDLH